MQKYFYKCMLQTISGFDIPFLLTESRRARRVYLKISCEKGLEIVIPKRFKIKDLPQILREKETWIRKNIQRVNERKNKKEHIQFSDGIKLSILENFKTVRFIHTSTKKYTIEENDTELRICMPLQSTSSTLDSLSPFSAFSILRGKEVLEKYLQKKAHTYFEGRTFYIAKCMNLDYQKISIRSQKSRWGSCSRKKNLSFNWRLIMAPLAVLDYVIIHELAHTVHFNHSKKFYAFIEKFCPEYKKHRAYLREASFVL